jgi:hypothetical protein
MSCSRQLSLESGSAIHSEATVSAYRNTLVTVTFALVIAILPSMAKRMPPHPVPPVVANGVEYSATGNGKDGFVIATDLSMRKQLWKVKVFHYRMKFGVEEDVQWVYITNLKLTDGLLLVRDEKARCYAVDVKSKRVKGTSCGDSFSVQNPADKPASR